MLRPTSVSYCKFAITFLVVIVPLSCTKFLFINKLTLLVGY